MNLVLLQVANYEDVGIKTLLVLTIIALSGVVVYLYKSIGDLNKEHSRAISDKDEKILQVIRDHNLDMKENVKDIMLVVEKYHQFSQLIKDVVNGSRTKI